ncbi:hypothetical protein PoB_005941800 [Plakobranchus ocellatus]|uniref:Uncharacterized protein n=1 Tax=Plakobranchus ocellatus TaxID=259542 RepID=A0AAV4CM30_9GAST|nr:hypothetical protein PoB_005941800 [Plakobranchus ocellatus]
MQTDSNCNTTVPQTLSSDDHDSNQNFGSLETVSIPSICQSHESSNPIPNEDAHNDSANIVDESQLSSAASKGTEVTVTELKNGQKRKLVSWSTVKVCQRQFKRL